MASVGWRQMVQNLDSGRRTDRKKTREMADTCLVKWGGRGGFSLLMEQPSGNVFLNDRPHSMLLSFSLFSLACASILSGWMVRRKLQTVMEERKARKFLETAFCFSCTSYICILSSESPSSIYRYQFWKQTLSMLIRKQQSIFQGVHIYHSNILLPGILV